MKTHELLEKFRDTRSDVEGRVLPPLILWMLGVPGIVVLLLWMFFFRG